MVTNEHQNRIGLKLHARDYASTDLFHIEFYTQKRELCVILFLVVITDDDAATAATAAAAAVAIVVPFSCINFGISSLICVAIYIYIALSFTFFLSSAKNANVDNDTRL